MMVIMIYDYTHKCCTKCLAPIKIINVKCFVRSILSFFLPSTKLKDLQVSRLLFL